MFQLSLRAPSPIPLEVDGITPERVAGLSALDVVRLPVLHGNRTEPLGEHFDVAPTARADIVFTGDTGNVKGIGAGMATGVVVVEGDVGMHAGARMAGGRMVVTGRAGNWLGAEMRGGSVEVGGDAGGQVGAAYRGSRRGMTGGVIRVHGSAGDEVGLLMRRGRIVVGGDCGEFAGAGMIAGSVIVLGAAGNRLGAGMKRGTIFVGRGVAELPPTFRLACEYRPTFLALYGRDLPTRSPVRCYRGDLLTGGRGEVLTPTV